MLGQGENIHLYQKSYNLYSNKTRDPSNSKYRLFFADEEWESTQFQSGQNLNLNFI